MGLTKRAMEEADSLIYDETEITFTCPKCKTVSDGSAEIPRLYKGQDLYFGAPIELVCIWCGADFEATLNLDGENDGITIEDYPEVGVEYEPIYFEDFSDEGFFEEEYYFDNPEDPIGIFRQAHSDLVKFCQTLATDSGHDAINRMIFTQSFSIYEAYLCDAFLNLVFKTDENQARFLTQHTGMKSTTFSVMDLVENSAATADEILKKKITQIIRKTLFHNLDRATALFRIYGLTMFGTDKERSLLFEAVEKRHHCVHRNGSDLDGNTLNDFDKGYCLKIIDAMLVSAEKIEAGFQNHTSEANEKSGC